MSDAAALDNDDTPDAPARASTDQQSRRWRSTWRIHFYAGLFAMPFILLMAVTGLVILYTQPIQDLLQDDLRVVSDQGDWVSFDDQAAAVEATFPDWPISSMTMPTDGTHATAFGVDDGSTSGRLVFVDPYSAEVLGSTSTDGDIVGLSNRLHGYLNNESVTIPLPTVSALFDEGPVMRDYVLGDLVLEVLGVWTLVLVFTGLYLWWPRRTNTAEGEANGRGVFKVRWSKGGRARWRDLHGLSGVLMTLVMLLTLVSGFGWSTYWGPNFTALANEITPNTWTDAPASPLGERGDLDRYGNQIPWNTGDRPIPSSYATEADGSLPAPIPLDTVVRIGAEEGMKPGYTVYFPANVEDEAGNLVYGSFTLSNSWPRATGEGRDLYLDQFTGESLDEMTGWGYGAISYGMDVLVSTHMGTQLGLVSRIFMTALCVLAAWSVISALVMFLKRRRKGTLGLPRRPDDVHFGRGLWVLLIGFAIVFPVWGAVALVILAIDRFFIRQVGPVRRTFGQR